MVGALGGVVLGLAFLRRRSTLGGRRRRPRPRRLRPARLRPASRSSPATRCSAAAILAIFAALALLGWRLLERRPPLAPPLAGLRRPGRADVRRSGCRTSGTSTHRVDDRPHQPGADRARPHRPRRRRRLREPLCGPIAVPNHRAVPRLAFGLDVKPTEIVSASEEGIPSRGYFLDPASALRHPQLHPRPQRPDPLLARRVRPASGRVAANESWLLYRRCCPAAAGDAARV